MTGKGRLKGGRFASGNTFAKGDGAPLRNQNAKVTVRWRETSNAVKTGEFMKFEDGESSYDRLRGGESKVKIQCVHNGHLLMRVKRKLSAEKGRLAALL